MPNRRASKAEGEARRRLAEAMRVAGSKIRAARRRRGLTQKALGLRVGLSQSAVSGIEIGEGASLSVLTWQRTAIALDVPLDFAIGRDAREEPPDAGHLDMQVLMLRLGRQIGATGTFELSTRPLDSGRSTDVGWRDDVRRRLTLIECVNLFGNINASIRSSDRKVAEATQLGAAMGQGDDYSVHLCWVVRDTRRSRELLTRYREIFISRFRGSSREWVAALTTGTQPPREPGLVWCDARATRLFEWRA